MAEAFKENLGRSAIVAIADAIKSQNTAFDKQRFIELASEDLDELSLMQRNRQIAEVLQQTLSSNFEQNCQDLVAACEEFDPLSEQVKRSGLRSWQSLPIKEYIGKYGVEDIPIALQALADITALFSAEFAIRHLLLADEDQVLKHLENWCEHDNHHVRRLVSEGTRPRLPWGFQLTSFIKRPEKTWPLLERLKDDSSDYVRLSVANHLNDIAKDHPDWLQNQLQNWVEPQNKHREKVIRHACRTLIKQGHAGTLNMLGYKPLVVADGELSILTPVVQYGDKLAFSFCFQSTPKSPVIIDYLIDFQKANGSLAPKVFKWKNTQLSNTGEFNGERSHAIKPVTTRRYYNGHHELAILVNGQEVARQSFTLEGC
ncbi:DNA alkylation repair protein [Bermanella marisrubri]|uniref:Putative DNA alkylation repair protein n=1 Tax=Bermanella marisrubri TaxID=207949 RepID=Q1MZZ1_9GAMM|nr:DNA alkylation repair protein [Bermanella marisrubri]EAT11572.1 putative DNA alkylation repair protein [Oceanobacter sp. RED65] [Bermanella marisrubri]QIZ84966.1 DNA alkylation repair protein [Bermanella marisrubri]